MELEPLHPLQAERFRRMSFEEKMAVWRGLFRMAQRARREAVRRDRPDLDDEACDRLVAKEFAAGRT